MTTPRSLRRSLADHRTSDQADGLRRLFAAQRARFVPVASNVHVAFAGVLLERLTAAFALLGLRVLVVDAAESAPLPHELSVLDLGSCIEPLSPQVGYLAARGLPMRYLDARGHSGALLNAVLDAAPGADVVLVHASASDLSRLLGARAARPVLLAADHPDSVMQAYAAMKLLAGRNQLMTYDLLLAAEPASPRRERIAAQLASCGDRFLGAVLRDWAAVDPASDGHERPGDDVLRIAQALLAADEEPALAVPMHGHASAAEWPAMAATRY